MIAAVREWLVGIIAASLLVSVADNLIPQGAIKKIAGFTGGLILLLALVQPVLHIQPGSIQGSLDNWSGEISALEEEFTQQNAAELEARIAETTASYICDKATSLGLDCQARVTTETGPEGVPIPVSAEVTGPKSEALAEYMEAELGIPKEKQLWKGP